MNFIYLTHTVLLLQMTLKAVQYIQYQTRGFKLPVLSINIVTLLRNTG